jgi:hypothetical protein
MCVCFNHVCVSDLYIPTISLPILLKENMWTNSGIIIIAHRQMNVDGIFFVAVHVFAIKIILR